MIAADVLLFGTLVVIGTAALVARDPRAAAIQFIAFGLLLAIAWVRLAAPDVALAEAAIGAGVTGALLLDAAARLTDPPRAARLSVRLGGVILAALAAAGLGLAVFSLATPDGAATRLAAERLPETGVAHPVTGVLLAYRAYDTLLEIGVLLAAVIAALALPGPVAQVRPAAQDPVLARVAVVTVPIAVLVAVYLLWVGAQRTGGAFQAGAVLAGALLLAHFSRLHTAAAAPGAARRALLAGGFATFLAIGTVAGVASGALLGYPPGWSGALILAIEAALAISIAVSMLALFGDEARP